MRCILVNPFYPIDETPSPPLGLAFLAAALEEAGIEVKILDYVVFPFALENLEAELKRFQPQMVGVTAVTMTYDNAVEVIRTVKKINPEIFTVMGGPHVSFCAPETLTQVPELDCVVKGEADESIVKLAQAIDSGQPLHPINGVVFRDGTDIVQTPTKNYQVDLDRLPFPARHLIPLGRYRALHMPISMTTSRGCPFKCIFCVGRKMVGAKVRYRDPLKVVDELEYLSHLNFHQINIADDLFTANKKRCMAVCDEIIKRGLKVQWASFARVDTVSLDLLKKMKAAGCSAVSFGVESANPGILKTIKKKISLDQVIAAVQMCMDADVIPHASFILGLPGETRETVQETKAFGDKIRAMGASYGFHLLAPFPGTDVRDHYQDYGIKILSHDWAQYHANKAIVETDAAPKELLDEIAGEWQYNLDKWLAHLKDGLKDGTVTPEEAEPLINLERTVILYDLMMKQAFEKLAPTPGSSLEDEEALKRLAESVKDITAYQADKVFDALQDAYKKGNIREVVNDKGLTWEWLDYLNPPEVP